MFVIMVQRILVFSKIYKMTKQDARYFYLNKRKKLSNYEFNLLNDKIIHQYYQFNFNPFHSIMSYAPILKNNEPNIQSIITPFFNQVSIKIFYPYTDLNLNSIIPIQVHQYPFEIIENKWGIQEPKFHDSLKMINLNEILISFIFVPLIIADKNGNRIGYGKGFYDRFFSQVKTLYRIGISIFEPIDVIEDATELDIKLTHCITPENCYEFK